MDNLELRISALESRNQVEHDVHVNGEYCDDGPYTPEPLVGLWTADGEFSADELAYRGEKEIYGFYDGLAAEYALHLFTNFAIEIDASGTKATLSCYGYESPVIDNSPLVGGFIHDVYCHAGDTDRRWIRWRQRMQFLSPALLGWAGDGERIVEQRKNSAVD